ncbi:hypothetical protein AA313_de0209209 [Arthrobotrys entomopaga]|nr:hypothetical protein AA313_de0209209 [Arthrobotrys entomopaga]
MATQATTTAGKPNDPMMNHAFKELSLTFSIPTIFKSLRVPVGTSHKRILLLVQTWELYPVQAVDLPAVLMNTITATVDISKIVNNPKETYPNQITISKIHFDKRNRDRAEVEIQQRFQALGGASSNHLLLTGKDNYTAAYRFLNHGSDHTGFVHESEFGLGVYLTDDVETALDYATIRGDGVILVYSKRQLEESMAGKIKTLAGCDWVTTLKHELGDQGAGQVPLPYRKSDYALLIGPISENHSAIIRRGADPTPGAVTRYVVTQDFRSLDACLRSIIFLM